VIYVNWQDASLNRQIEDLLRKQDAAVRRAFLAAIQDITSRTQLTKLRDALRRGDIQAAIEALNLESAAYQVFAAEIANTYTQAGAIIAAGRVWRAFDLSRVVHRFDVTNPEAEAYLRNVSSSRITRVVQDQIEAVRIVINAGYAQGRHPNSIALDIVGRVGPSGARSGGIVGLSQPQAQWVVNMREYLTNDPARALQMTRRDRRFDRAIMKAIETGRPLTTAQIDRMVSRYSDRLLQLRAEGIARSETGMAVETARHDTWRQYQQKNGIPDRAVVKKWFHGGPAANGRERPTHVAMHQQEVRGLDTPFLVGGVPMRYPLDPNAPVDEIVNCRCTYTINVDWSMLAV